MENALKSAMIETVSKLSKKYEFDFQEAIAYLSLDDKVRVNIGTKPKEPRVIKRKQPSFPVPFSGEMIENCCIAILPNKGLYSQCLNEPTSNGFCSSCFKKFPNGNPTCGTVSFRIEKGEDYTDPKGKKPIHFTQIMKKLDLTEEFVLSEVTKYHIPFDTNHFVEPQTKRGRPKKEQTDSPKTTRPKKATNQIEVALFDEPVTDLLQQLVQEEQLAPTPQPPAPMPRQPANLHNLSLQYPTDVPDDEEHEDEISDITEASHVEDSILKEIVIQETAKEEKAKKEAAKKEKELEKARKQEEKAKKEAAKKEKEEEKAKKEAAKKEKEEEKAKKEAAKKQKEEEKAKKEQEKAEKEAAKKEKTKKETAKKVVEPPPQPKPTATIIEYNGTSYYLKDDNTVYDMNKNNVGYWNPEDKAIIFEDEEEDEEEEEEEEEELVEDSDEE